LSDVDAAALDDLVEKSGAATLAEVLRNALAFYRWCVQHAQEGYEFGASRQDDNVILRPVILGLSSPGKGGDRPNT